MSRDQRPPVQLHLFRDLYAVEVQVDMLARQAIPEPPPSYFYNEM
jgi:hypothetical protein